MPENTPYIQGMNIGPHPSGSPLWQARSTTVRYVWLGLGQHRYFFAAGAFTSRNSLQTRQHSHLPTITTSPIPHSRRLLPGAKSHTQRSNGKNRSTYFFSAAPLPLRLPPSSFRHPSQRCPAITPARRIFDPACRNLNSSSSTRATKHNGRYRNRSP